MATCARSIFAAVIFLNAATALAQQIKPAAGRAPIVQPGAPGQRSKTLSPSKAGVPVRAPAETDVSFMQGMIHHHAQAVEMVDLLRARGQSRELQALGTRISISQTDEIKYMQQWLEERGKPISPISRVSMGHSHMDHLSNMPLMPGMFTPEPMAALAKAKG